MYGAVFDDTVNIPIFIEYHARNKFITLLWYKEKYT